MLGKGVFLGVVFGVVGVIVAGAVLGGRQVQSNAGFCGACHAESNEGWATSGAADKHPTCIECHSGSGPLGILEAELRAAGHIAAYPFGARPDSGQATMQRSFCTQCHDSREELLHQHHDWIPARSGVSVCLQCHDAGQASTGAETAPVGATTPSCGACHKHSATGPLPRNALGSGHVGLTFRGDQQSP